MKKLCQETPALYLVFDLLVTAKEKQLAGRPLGERRPALEAFAKARGITVIVDGSQVPVVYAADSIDITRSFINEFNSKNPATASLTPPQ